MQIALISWRTLGASELRLLASLLSLACVCFFHCVVCFLAVIVVVFEVLCPPQPPPQPQHVFPPNCRHSSPSLFPPHWSRGWNQVFFHGGAGDLDYPSTDQPVERRLTGSCLEGGRSSRLQTWEIWGHFLASQLWCGPEPDFHSVRCFVFSSKRGLTLASVGCGNAMDLRCNFERNNLRSLF